MGEQRVSLLKGDKQMQKFVKSLLADVRALEHMLEHGWFENDITRIGAEQEMVMIHNDSYKPASIAIEALEKMEEYPWVETELAKFNLETNLDPRTYTGSCFSDLHKENSDKLNKIQEVLDTMDVSLVLTGILPTLRKYHLDLDYLTPKKRYFALMESINKQLIGPSYELKLSGLDELALKHDSPLLEACNTSFQVHLQVSSDEFVKKYNIAQALTGPIIAISANSPIVFGKRLWHESRIALFQQALDTRSSHSHMRERSPRVTFGNDWLQESILEIYQEDIMRHRVLISSDVEENSTAMIAKGDVPKLRALQVHNSTVYRWNRPCYGISDNGKPHLRIECRVIPSGPTVADEIANACLWLGMMEGMALEFKDIKDHLSFDDVRDNFNKASKYGMDTKFTWFNDTKIAAKDLLVDQLIPIARKGLTAMNVDQVDIDYYMGIIEARVKAQMTGARWMLRSFTELKKKTGVDQALSTLTATIIENQISGKLVHEWETPKPNKIKDYRPAHLLVSEFMTTDLLTVHGEDIVDLVAEMMDWKNLKYVPVEDTKGNFIGLVSSAILLKHYLKHKTSRKTFLVKDIMVDNPITVEENTSIVDALEIMREKEVGCLPVLQGTELVGMITTLDYLKMTSGLIDNYKLSN
jgi:CBS domain-containing protein/gamma-glutamylcysteine synthetase